MTPTQLKAIREQLGWTQAELADKLGVRMNSVWRWESGEVPIAETVALAVDHLLCLRKTRKKSKE